MRKSLRIEAASGEGLAGRGGVRIRLVRLGRKKLPYYRIIVASSRSRRDGKFLEMVGVYNPLPGNNTSPELHRLANTGKIIILELTRTSSPSLQPISISVKEFYAEALCTMNPLRYLILLHDEIVFSPISSI